MKLKISILQLLCLHNIPYIGNFSKHHVEMLDLYLLQECRHISKLQEQLNLKEQKISQAESDRQEAIEELERAQDEFKRTLEDRKKEIEEIAEENQQLKIKLLSEKSMLEKVKSDEKKMSDYASEQEKLRLRSEEGMRAKQESMRAEQESMRAEQESIRAEQERMRFEFERQQNIFQKENVRLEESLYAYEAEFKRLKQNDQMLQRRLATYRAESDRKRGLQHHKMNLREPKECLKEDLLLCKLSQQDFSKTMKCFKLDSLLP